MEISFTRRNEYGMADISIANGDVVIGDDLHTAIGLSLFSNRRADSSTFSPEVLNSNQGWWGDIFRDSPLGSVYWQLARRKRSEAVLELVRAASVQSLSWLTEDGIASSIEVTTSWLRVSAGLMDVKIVVTRSTGGTSSFNYQFVWDNLEGE